MATCLLRGKPSIEIAGLPIMKLVTWNSSDYDSGLVIVIPVD